MQRLGEVATDGHGLADALHRRGEHGISLRELIDEFCGGMLEDHMLYGYFPGGASGGILPASLADLPLDFDPEEAEEIAEEIAKAQSELARSEPSKGDRAP